MSILVTGASGFIGAHLSKVFPHVIESSRKPHDKRILIEDLNDSVDWKTRLNGIDQIIHLANLAHGQYSKSEYERVNEKGSMHLAEEAAKAGVKRFVFLSSVNVHGDFTHSGNAFAPNSKYNPSSQAAISKVKLEKYLFDLGRRSNMQVVIVRSTLVYGLNAPGNFGLLVKLIRNVPFLPFGLINNKRNFISIYNLVDLLFTCTVHPKASGHTFFASDLETVSIRSFTSAVAKGLGKKIIQVPIPGFVIKFAGKLTGKSMMVDHLLNDLQVNSSNLGSVLDWKPPYTMEESMAFLCEINNREKNDDTHS
ncbi:NAD-dependent epimerase/dehydratase [Vibrio crassostreae]|uniref:NAD-dependent epimerase/dehydratase family protein n=1 Tax=Vibrio crassostreae TaxID=246167 RepID=UPI00104487C5|nr:NAD-dependent epimerase/dehydratase family protein [Vibrio crassostreae]TCN85189.1 nucleoside-diphosphate-sugar epimerase [Vibrio crassostreae]CAK3028869.1 NAD-dependent epimerase/dehydratase [Vibrio crassostreae]